jgi:hypothetical protein
MGFLLEIPPDNDHRVRSHDVDHDIPGELREMVGADYDAVSSAPNIVHPRFYLDYMPGARLNFQRPNHPACNATKWEATLFRPSPDPETLRQERGSRPNRRPPPRSHDCKGFNSIPRDEVPRGLAHSRRFSPVRPLATEKGQVLRNELKCTRWSGRGYRLGLLRRKCGTLASSLTPPRSRSSVCR